MEAPEFRASAICRPIWSTLLTSGDICSKRWIWEQYDYMVRTNTTRGPGADAAVVRIKETGTSVAMSLDGNERYCYLDPREGARLMVAECCRNLSTVGAEPVAATNNLNFGNPERPEIMAQLVEAIEGMAEACEFFGTPITGGNVSLYNETLGEPIHPSPVMGIVGLMKTAQPRADGLPERRADVILLLGGLGDLRRDPLRRHAIRQGRSRATLWGLPPALDMDLREARARGDARDRPRPGLAESAHDLGGGGLAVALAECSFGPTIDRRRCPAGLRTCGASSLLFRRGSVADPGLDDGRGCGSGRRGEARGGGAGDRRYAGRLADDRRTAGIASCTWMCASFGGQWEKRCPQLGECQSKTDDRR